MAYDTYLELTYGADPVQTLNLYTPVGASSAPVVVFVHGGAWQFGRKEFFTANKITYFTDKGAIFISIDYPLYPESAPVNQSAKVSDVIDWLTTNAAAYGGDPTKIILLGHSSGAHVSALIATKYPSHQVAGTILLDTDAYDIVQIMTSCFNKKADLYEPFGTDPAYWELASPARGGETPELLVVTSIHRVDLDSIIANFIAEFSADSEVVDLTHSEINRNIGVDLVYSDILWDWIVTKT